MIRPRGAGSAAPCERSRVRNSQGYRTVTKLPAAAAVALVTGLIVSGDAFALPAVQAAHGRQHSPLVSHGEVGHGRRHQPWVGGAGAHAFNYQVVSPRDAASGLPTGKRMHKPYTVTAH
jgi:hypothetical protein